MTKNHNLLIHKLIIGTFEYQVQGSFELGTIKVAVMDKNGIVIFESYKSEYKGNINNIELWWPRGMGAPVLYRFVVRHVLTI